MTALAELVCRVGDLDADGVIVGPSAREGLEAHRRLQRASGAECERRLVRRVTIDGAAIELTGRIDLLERERRLLGEIKSALVPAERVPDAKRALQWAQLMLYGWLYLGEPAVGDAPLALELVHVNLRDGRVERLRRQATAETLERHAREALERWLGWQRGVERRRHRLVESARALAFPHARFRAGQREMAVAVYRALRDGGALLCEAPTGVGKTISALYPAIKALGEGHRRQLLYLTAKISGRQSALDALARLAASGLAIGALALRSREDSCFCERGECGRNADGRCPMTLGFFDRLPAARAELVEAGVVDPARLDEAARRHRLCPHALARELVPWTAVIVCDYNHVFDPLARLARLDEDAAGAALLVDEAHNLLERSRAMFSVTLSRARCRDVAAALAPARPAVARALGRLERALRDAARAVQASPEVRREPPSGLGRRAGETLEVLLAGDIEGRAVPLPPVARALANDLARLLAVLDLYGEDHRCLIETRRAGRRREVTLRLLCVDAARELERRRAAFGASVLFSATLAPSGFYRAALGLPGSCASLALPSPFDARRALHCVIPWVDVRYRHRERSLDDLLSLIAQVVDSRIGNYLVFLPSYAYLERVHAAFARAYPGRETWRQLPGQGEEARRATLARLDAPGHRVGFAILGGSYGEGIDYRGERLIGVVVVGAGLAPPDLARELVAARYRERGLDGFDFAVRYPGFTRVRQSVGRVIRGERDRGVVVLVDSRFDDPFYRRLFPADWGVRRPRDAAEVARLLERFWSEAARDEGPPSAGSEPHRRRRRSLAEAGDEAL